MNYLDDIARHIAISAQWNAAKAKQIVAELADFDWNSAIEEQERHLKNLHEEYLNSLRHCDECRAEFVTKELHKIKGIPSREYFLYCKPCAVKVVQSYTRICFFCEEPYRTKRCNESPGLCGKCDSAYRMCEVRRLRIHLRRACKHGVPSDLKLKDWLYAIEYFNGLCAYCQVNPLEDMDHIISIERGGGTTVGNCIPSCGSCNSRKGRALLNDCNCFSQKAILQIQDFVRLSKDSLGRQEN